MPRMSDLQPNSGGLPGWAQTPAPAWIPREPGSRQAGPSATGREQLQRECPGNSMVEQLFPGPQDLVVTQGLEASPREDPMA